MNTTIIQTREGWADLTTFREHRSLRKALDAAHRFITTVAKRNARAAGKAWRANR